MFIGRKSELKSLEELYKKPGFSMTVITGRRRVGKSALISEFLKDKKAIYYVCTKVGDTRNIELLSRQSVRILEPDYPDVMFKSIEDLLDFITIHLGKKKLVFAIDELPYWAGKNEALLSILQKYIDNDWKDKNIFLILCGSSLSFMEEDVLSKKSPLFGRRNSQILLKPFDYHESAEFVPGYSYEEKAVCFGVTGGIAKYLSLFDASLSLDENIKKLFFTTDGYLYDEPDNLLVQEFSDVSVVSNIISQIAAGENTLNLIADKIHENPSTVLYSLNRLISVGIIGKKNCITEEKNKKKIQYVLGDNMFRFWFRFVSPALSYIEMKNGGAYYDNYVKPGIHEYMGPVFEQMCRYFTLERGLTGEWGQPVTKVGTWWGMERFTDADGNKITRPADIDVVAISDINKTMITGECKFRNEPISQPVYETLVRRSKLIHTDYPITDYLLFSLSGFTEWYKNVPEMVSLYTLEDLYG